jgi:hypothetical protein
MIELLAFAVAYGGPPEIPHLIPHFALQGYGPFDPIISNIKNFLRSLALLGVLGGTAVKATAGVDTDKHELSHKIIGTCIFAFIFVSLAPGLYDLMFSWTGK